MTAPGTIRVRRVWLEDDPILDAEQGVSGSDAGELLAIDMSSTPPDYAFEMKVYNDAVPATPAAELAEVEFPIERLYTTQFKSRDPYASTGITKAVAP